MTKEEKKMTMRGYQTALGIARRKNSQMRKSLAEQTRRADNAESDLATTKASLKSTTETVYALRRALGEIYPTFSDVKYRRVSIAVNLDVREYMEIPPMHIHVTQKGYDYGLCGHERSYLFDLYIPEYEVLDYGTALIVHDRMQKLVDFVARRPFDCGIMDDTKTGAK